MLQARFSSSVCLRIASKPASLSASALFIEWLAVPETKPYSCILDNFIIDRNKFRHIQGFLMGLKNFNCPETCRRRVISRIIAGNCVYSVEKNVKLKKNFDVWWNYSFPNKLVLGFLGDYHNCRNTKLPI